MHLQQAFPGARFPQSSLQTIYDTFASAFSGEEPNCSGIALLPNLETFDYDLRTTFASNEEFFHLCCRKGTRFANASWKFSQGSMAIVYREFQFFSVTLEVMDSAFADEILTMFGAYYELDDRSDELGERISNFYRSFGGLSVPLAAVLTAIGTSLLGFLGPGLSVFKGKQVLAYKAIDGQYDLGLFSLPEWAITVFSLVAIFGVGLTIGNFAVQNTEIFTRRLVYEGAKIRQIEFFVIALGCISCFFIFRNIWTFRALFGCTILLAWLRVLDGTKRGTTEDRELFRRALHKYPKILTAPLFSVVTAGLIYTSLIKNEPEYREAILVLVPFAIGIYCFWWDVFTYLVREWRRQVTPI